MSILPSFLTLTTSETEEETTSSVLREYGIDFDTGELTGRIVEGVEAIKVWIWLCLKTYKERFQIYSSEYGVTIEDYIGQNYSQAYMEADAESDIEEALTVNEYIESIDDFELTMENDTVTVSFTVNTTLGDEEVSVSV